MKTPFRTFHFAVLALVGLSASAVAADTYSVFRICEDQRILKTSDGADCGHIEYLVVDPGEQRIVSTVITGGVVGERHVCVPFADFQVTGDREILLNQITRESIVAAPVIEVDRFRTSSFVEPALIEKSSAYFKGNAHVNQGVRKSGEEKQLAPSGHPADPQNAGRDARDERNVAPRNGNVRDNRAGEQPRDRQEPSNQRGQAGIDAAPPANRNGEERAPQENKPPQNAPAKPEERNAQDRQGARAEQPRAGQEGGKNSNAEPNREAKPKKEENVREEKSAPRSSSEKSERKEQ